MILFFNLLKKVNNEPEFIIKDFELATISTVINFSGKLEFLDVFHFFFLFFETAEDLTEKKHYEHFFFFFL